ncbi:MAG: DUF4258 domain-containing protein [Candidatus Aenigmarchaeota archaeon]|nr:DUF4258 domain-containing protein [Candidatus Aenigmarchaeota archaeon]
MDWIPEALQRYDRQTVYIDISLHALKHKNLTPADIDMAEETIRRGRPVPEKSDEKRQNVCFRLYYGKENATYTVIAGLHPNFIRIVTIIKEEGRI